MGVTSSTRAFIRAHVMKSFFRSLRCPFIVLLGCTAAALAVAQPGGTALPPWQPPQNVLQLSASATAEIPQDQLALTLAVTREGADAGAVQQQLRSVLEPALAEARRLVERGQLDVRSGNFAVFPRHGRDGRIQSWQGTAELVLEGRDISRIAQAAARVPGMTVSGMAFSLSREEQQRAQEQVQRQAVETFRARAASLSRDFGFSGYTLREISVQSHEQGAPRPRMAAMEARAAANDASVPVEAGRAIVVVSVSGSVQMTR
jgi:predicted secreted protein